MAFTVTLAGPYDAAAPVAGRGGCAVDVSAKKLAESLTLDQIASLLGHSNNKTTKGYVH